MPKRVERSDAEWRERLTPEQYWITRRKGTEPPFSGRYAACSEPGTYRCVCCGSELFRSGDKFESGSGWPSFTTPAAPEAVRAEADRTLRIERTEVVCASCDAHLGHVFPDGPEPDGMRYCINSAALDLDPDS